MGKSEDKKAVGFIGAGVMGKSMAAHLLDAGYRVRVYTRTKDKAVPLLEKGAEWRGSPAEAAEGSGATITMVGFPADVEATLSQHPKIVEVAVVGIADAEMGERVCAFVVCGDGNPIDLIEIKSFLEAKGLARFKWPERVELVKSLPRVASGYKIDKKKLKENFAARAASD